MKERRKDLPWLLLALLAITFTVIKDENGKKISYEELEEGDYILITTDNYVLLTYPMQYSNIYKVQKTGESDKALAESIYQKYKTEFAFK